MSLHDYDCDATLLNLNADEVFWGYGTYRRSERVGRPHTATDIERLIVPLARENRE